MMDSLAYRNEAASIFRRLIRSLPGRKGVLGVATCDKSLPAMMMALASMRDLPVAIVPGGVTLPPEQGEDLGTIQSVGARFAQGEVTLDYARQMTCRACAGAGGGCQFLGTAATAQVVAEALGLTLPHAALAPSGQEIWLDIARRSARALRRLSQQGLTAGRILSNASIRNAMTVFAAFGGSTNLLLHIPAIAFAAGLDRPTIDDWNMVNRKTPRLVDVLPNGPVGHPTVRAYLAGGVPEVMLHLRQMGLLDLEVLTITGQPLGPTLDWWERSDRRRRLREILHQKDGVDPDDVIMPADRARARGLTGTITLPQGNLAPQGAVDQEHGHRPLARGCRRRLSQDRSGPGLYRRAGRHPGDPGGRRAAGRYHGGDLCRAVGQRHGGDPPGYGRPEESLLGQARGGHHRRPLQRRQHRGLHRPRRSRKPSPADPSASFATAIIIQIVDRPQPSGGQPRPDRSRPTRRQSERSPELGRRILAERPLRPDLAPYSDMPDDTRLWAALQEISGGTWAGCVYDTGQILRTLEAGRRSPPYSGV